MYAKHSIGVVVPAYNEEQLIKTTLESIPFFVDRIYAVNDCSNDSTGAIIQECRDRDPRIKYLEHGKNLGVGAAISSGYKLALKDGMDIVAVMAGDNQMDPRHLPHLLDPIIWDIADYTKGNRLFSPEYRIGMNKWRSLGNSMLTFLTKFASGYWYIMDPQNGYTAISRRALKTLNINDLYPGYGYCNDLLVKLNVNNFRVMDVIHPARYGKERSKIKYGRYIFRVSRLLLKDFFWRLNTKYSLKGFHPVFFFYLCGIILNCIGVGGMIFTLYYKLTIDADLFFRGTFSLIIFIIGLQFLFLGMMFDMEQKMIGSSRVYFAGAEVANISNNHNLNNHNLEQNRSK